MPRAPHISERGKAGIAGGIAAAIALAIALGAGAVAVAEHRGSHPPASANPPSAREPDGFPKVDWKRWQKVNPDVIGWITIPGTHVDQPIAQAPESDPQFYLAHDVYGKPNFTGCPYLEAACMREGGLLACRNSVVYGHNMGWNPDLFGDLARYRDKAYAREHQLALLQTPTQKVRLKVQAVSVIPAAEGTERIRFADEADFRTWWRTCLECADVALSPAADRTDAVLTLCTCSYSRWDDERTLVRLVPAETEKEETDE